MKNDFIPVTRFIVCSDAHIEGIGTPGYNRLKKTIDFSLDFASADEHYNKIDSFFIAGDITNSGKKEEFDSFKEIYDYGTQKGLNILCTVAKGHDSISMGKKSLEYYRSLTNQETDFHRVIGGYHFIGISTSRMKKHFNSAFQKIWLKKELDKAVKDTPDKPVFVMHHEHIKYTVFGSYDEDGWGKILFADLLKKYPNVVDFSGHSHYPVNDPRSVWQKEYTAIGTGSLKYTELTVDGEQKIHPPFYNECANFLVVEADKDSNLRISGVDCIAGQMLCEYYLKNPADKNNREYEKEKQIARSFPPVFADDAAITIDEKNGIYTAVYPAAESDCGFPVFIYRVSVSDTNGKILKTIKTIPAYYLYGEEKTLSSCLGMLSSGKYTVKVLAENVYGAKSDVLEKTIEL
ncbi:MAG: metallophosphoesterase [Clostridia bacterium]|nr:metallophosphoesterase [Clostridia bacterium]